MEGWQEYLRACGIQSMRRQARTRKEAAQGSDTKHQRDREKNRHDDLGIAIYEAGNLLIPAKNLILRSHTGASGWTGGLRRIKAVP